MDQAETLRKWALEQVQKTQNLLANSSRVKKPLVVIGFPGAEEEAEDWVFDRMNSWADMGHNWVGYLDDWDIHSLSPGDSGFRSYAATGKRWAIWIDSDADAFQKTYQLLKSVRENGGPKRILALHEPGLDSKGLLGNLRQVAADFFDIDLIFLGS